MAADDNQLAAMPRVLVAGGGTAGHVTPALAVAAALGRRGARLLFIGSRRPADAELVRAAGFDFVAISTGKLRRYLTLTTLFEPAKVLLGSWQAWRIIRRFRPTVIFAKGGFVSLPVIWAARWAKVPVVLHESDTVPGLANRWGAQAAAQIAVAFPPDTLSGLPTAKLTYTGNPIRREVLTGQAARAQRRFKLSAKLPVLLVLGGSQGSRAINQLVTEALPKLLPEMQVVHQVGNAAAAEIIAGQAQLKPEWRDRYRPQGFFGSELFDLYAAADLVVSRAGANGLAEIAATGKPSVLIPLPTAAAGHQERNAAVFRESGAATVLAEEGLTAAELARTIKRLLHDGQRRAAMGRAARGLAVLDATDKVAELVWRTGAHRG